MDATYGADAIDALRRPPASGWRCRWRPAAAVSSPSNTPIGGSGSTRRIRRWAKVLVRYNTDGDAATNERQRHRLLDLQTVARAIGVGFLFELLVPPEPNQRTPDYDTEVRPDLVVRALEELREAGIAPDLWKIEGLDRREDCARVADARRRARAWSSAAARTPRPSSVGCAPAPGCPASTGSRSADRSGGTPFAPTWTAATDRRRGGVGDRRSVRRISSTSTATRTN